LPHREDAHKIMGHIDLKDVPYMAAALTFEGSVIWSNDKHFDMQSKIKVVKTREMIPKAD
jgi:predicted nucleic acid-binding protein